MADTEARRVGPGKEENVFYKRNVPSETSCSRKTCIGLKPVLILLMIAGLSWNPYEGKRSRINSVLLRIWSVLMILLYLLQGLAMSSCYARAEGLPEFIMLVSSQLFCGFAVLFVSFGLNLAGLLKRFNEALSKLQTESQFEKHVPYKYTSRLIFIYSGVVFCCAILICVVFFVLTSGLVVTELFAADSKICINSPFPRNSVMNSVYKYLLPIVSFFITVIYSSMICQFITLTLCVANQYRACTTVLSEMTVQGVEEHDLDRWNRRYTAVTDLNDCANNMLSKYVGTGYLVSILLFCITLYHVTGVEPNTASSIQAVMFGSTSLWHITIFTICGVKVNEAAQGPLEILHRLEGGMMSDRVMALVTLMTNRLTQREIGVSALGLLVINKSTVLAIFGTLLTYVFIAVSFKPETAKLCTNSTLT